jgi:soluble lytic murein transglycosylase-like protein
MMKKEEQMSIETGKNKVSTSYLRTLKRLFVKTSKTLLFMAMLMFLNVGAKYPIMSGTLNSSTTIRETSNMVLIDTETKAEYEKYAKMYQEIYKESLIQQIEFEAEVLIPDNFPFKYVEYAYKVSQQIGIPTRVMFRLIFRESSFDDNVISSAGALGLMQLMPDTRDTYYKNLRVDTMKLDINQADIYIGANYIKDLQEFWRDRGNSEKTLMSLALASYNAGPAKVIKYKGVPPYKDTRDFITFILKPHSNPVFYANILRKSSLKKNIS